MCEEFVRRSSTSGHAHNSAFPPDDLPFRLICECWDEAFPGGGLPETLRESPAFGCMFGCIVECRVAQSSPNSTTYREAKLLSPHNRDVGLHIFKTGDWRLAVSMVRSTRTRFRQYSQSSQVTSITAGLTNGRGLAKALRVDFLRAAL